MQLAQERFRSRAPRYAGFAARLANRAALIDERYVPYNFDMMDGVSYRIDVTSGRFTIDAVWPGVTDVPVVSW